ncbi:MAG: hypothetical protein CME69_09325 [Halobacteriovorax sp.]|nr:hypothetical protein [Halobacteriovorax sp.]
MYKLVAIGGKIRGEEFKLSEGDNVIGRSDEADVIIGVKGISKKHLLINVSGRIVYAEDLGSANGTFVNGKVIKKATIINGDKITLPNVILQVVYVKEKKKIIKKRVASDDDEPTYLTGGDMPDNIVGKIFWLFKFRLMNIIHGINEEYEWKALLGVLLAVFVVVNVALTINPTLETTRNIVLKEVAQRGKQIAEEMTRTNGEYLRRGDISKINSSFLDNSKSVVHYDLFDVEGRIYRPDQRRNQIANDAFSAKVKEWANGDSTKTSFVIRWTNGEIGIGQKIYATDINTGAPKVVAILAIRFKPSSLAEEASKSRVAFFEALITSFIAAIVLFGILYNLTIRHVEEMRFQIEEVLRGKRKSLEPQWLWEELTPLRDSINTLVQRFRELNNDIQDDDLVEKESDEVYVANLYEFMQGANGPVLILNSERAVSYINQEAEDILSMRESTSQGENIENVARNRGLAAKIISICDASAENAGTCQQTALELEGEEYNMYVSSLIGKDNLAKAFYITFVRL